LVDLPNMGAAFHDVELGARLADGLALPVAVDRDTRVALVAETAFGAAIGVRDVVYLTVSTGVGGAVLSDGQPLIGPDGTAGELGHLCVELDGPPCGCGARGHLEALASGTAIARLARESGAFDAGVSARDVAAAEAAGDAVAAAIMGRARRAFAAACVSIVDIFDPELVVVGGAVARNQGDRWLDPAREQVKLHAFRSPGRRVRIVPARLGADVGLIGAQPLVGARASAGTLIHPSTKPVRIALAAVAGA
ncbi:MAG: ROK family protein, partial [Candidatus Limnocylindrales bacterium]